LESRQRKGCQGRQNFIFVELKKCQQKRKLQRKRQRPRKRKQQRKSQQRKRQQRKRPLPERKALPERKRNNPVLSSAPLLKGAVFYFIIKNLQQRSTRVLFLFKPEKSCVKVKK
jgi:hypothetical protein